MIYLAYALMFCTGIGSTVYLVLQGHPWFAFFILCVTASLSMTGGEKDTEP